MPTSLNPRPDPIRLREEIEVLWMVIICLSSIVVVAWAIKHQTEPPPPISLEQFWAP
jgi:hypothetical protein